MGIPSRFTRFATQNFLEEHALMAINSAIQNFQNFSRLPARAKSTRRKLYYAISSLLGALFLAGCIFVYREELGLSGGRLALIWIIGLLYQLIITGLMDVATTFLPFDCALFVIVTWIFVNMVSVWTRNLLAPRFYKVMYALPDPNLHETLITIISGGAVDQLYHNLLVLFAWALLPQALAVLANIHRYRVAKKFERGERKNRVTNKRMRVKRSNGRIFRVLKINT